MKKLIFSLLAIVGFATASMAQDSTTYKEFYGIYKFNDGSPVAQVEVLWQDNILNLTSDMGTATMELIGKDSFSMSYAGGTIVFQRDSVNKKVISLTIYVSGMELVGTRVEPASAYFNRRYMRKEEPVAAR
jgi:hypothetical protein